MIVTISGVVFILLTAMFGVTVNKNTGEVSFDLSPGDDWSKPQLNKRHEDDNNVNPMRQFPDWIYFAMIIGYFVAVGMVCHGWFDYMRYREKIRKEILDDRRRNKRNREAGSCEAIESIHGGSGSM